MGHVCLVTPLQALKGIQSTAGESKWGCRTHCKRSIFRMCESKFMPIFRGILSYLTEYDMTNPEYPQ